MRGASAYQIVYFFPQMLSLVIIAVLWGFVYNPNTGQFHRCYEATAKGIAEAPGIAVFHPSGGAS